MANIRKTNLTLPLSLAIDLDVLCSRYNVSKKDMILCFISSGCNELDDSKIAEHSKETAEYFKNVIPLTKTSRVLRTKDENKKYENLYGLKTEEEFKADEESISYLGGLGDDL